MLPQVAAAKAPQVLAPRRRKAVNYNESKLHRKYASASESEQTAAKADTDAAPSDNEDGAEVKVLPSLPATLHLVMTLHVKVQHCLTMTTAALHLVMSLHARVARCLTLTHDNGKPLGSAQGHVYEFTGCDHTRLGLT